MHRGQQRIFIAGEARRTSFNMTHRIKRIALNPQNYTDVTEALINPQPFFENSFRGQTGTVYLLFWPVGALQRSVYKTGNNGQVLTKQGNNFIDLFHFVAPDKKVPALHNNRAGTSLYSKLFVNFSLLQPCTEKKSKVFCRQTDFD